MLGKISSAFIALTLVAGGSALAADNVLVMDNAVPQNSGLVGLGGIGGGPEALLYSNTTETSSRFDPTAANTATATPTPISFDDIPIPNARLGGATSINVTRVTVGIRRLANAPAVTVGLNRATFSDTATAPDTVLNTPSTFVSSQALAANGAASVTQLVTFGDGVNTLFTTSLNPNVITGGFSTFAIGVSLAHAADANSLNGWRLTTGPDANADAFWIYDTTHTTQTTDEGQYNFGAGGPIATFYVTVEGTPVPEPTSLALVGLGGMALVARRRRA